MTKAECAKYAGGIVYAMVKRMGGIGRDIHCITEYSITERGTLRYQREVMNCVANKRQHALAGERFPVCVCGRPTAETITPSDIISKEAIG